MSAPNTTGIGAYSAEVRSLVLSMVENGLPYKEIEAITTVSVNTIGKWAREAYAEEPHAEAEVPAQASYKSLSRGHSRGVETDRLGRIIQR